MSSACPWAKRTIIPTVPAAAAADDIRPSQMQPKTQRASFAAVTASASVDETAIAAAGADSGGRINPKRRKIRRTRRRTMTTRRTRRTRRIS